MKFLLSIMLGLMAFTSLAQTAPVPMPDLRSPEEILVLAAKNRYNFMDAVYEIRNSSMERRPIAENISYMMILPQLKEIENTLKYSELGVTPTEELAEYLTGTLSRRAHIEDMSSEEINTFVKWSIFENIYSLIEEQSRHLMSKERTEDQWENYYLKATQLLLAVKKAPYVTVMLEDTASTLQGEILIQYFQLFHKTIPVETMIKHISEVESGDTLEKTLKLVGLQWGKTKNPDLKLKFFRLTIATSEKISTIKNDSLFSTMATLGETLLYQVFDLLNYNTTIDLSELERVTPFFNRKDWMDLVNYLVNISPDNIPYGHYATTVYLTEKSLELPSNAIYKEDRIKLKSMSRQLAVANIDAKILKEGLHVVEKGGQQFYLWILYSVPWKIQAQLVNNFGDTLTTFGISEFNIQDKKLTLLTKNADGNANINGTKLEIFLNKPEAGITGKINNNRDVFDIKLGFKQAIPTIKSTVAMRDGVFLGTNNSIYYSLEMSRTAISSWDVNLSAWKPKAAVETKMQFQTIGACFETSSFCDFALDTLEENHWGFMRGAMVNENEFEGFIIQGLKLTTIRLKTN